MTTSQDLIEIIHRIPGKKIVTICTDSQSRAFDIDVDGTVGYAPEAGSMFRTMLASALNGDAGIIVRQFIPDPDNVLPDDPNSDKKLPWKALYGLRVAKDTAYALPASEVHISMTTDAMTGRRIAFEPYARCMDISDFAPELPILPEEDEPAPPTRAQRRSLSRGLRSRRDKR